MTTTTRLALTAALAATLTHFGLLGCTRTVDAPEGTVRYGQLELRDVPPALEGTLLQLVNLENVNDLQVSGYGLVVNLDGTGDTAAAQEVREYILKEMLRNGIGQANGPMPGVTREQVLADPRVAIVRVDGLIPPGARRGDRFDVQVSALNGNETSSLAGGSLWLTRLRQSSRVSQFNPGEIVNVLARSQGPIFVNPEHAFAEDPDSAASRGSLRRGLILDGGISDEARPLALRIRQPRLQTARYAEARINRQFLSEQPAAAQDEGVVIVNVPPQYGDDWEHFAGVVLHLYPSVEAGFAVAKARELAELARQPDAPLANVSYALEGLGKPAVPAYIGLIDSGDQDVAYAAARAAAFNGDAVAERALVRMATTDGHARRVEAVESFGKLARTPGRARTLMRIAQTDNARVRVSAYDAMARHPQPPFPRLAVDRKFLVDRVRGDNDPLVYATTRGTPRLGLLGRDARLSLPITWGSDDRRLTISTDPDRDGVVRIYDRGIAGRRPVAVSSGRDLRQLVAVLGGEVPKGAETLDLTYAEVLSVVETLIEQGHVVGPDGEPVALELEALEAIEDQIRRAPQIPEGRPGLADADVVSDDELDAMVPLDGGSADSVVPSFGEPGEVPSMVIPDLPPADGPAPATTSEPAGAPSMVIPDLPPVGG